MNCMNLKIHFLQLWSTQRVWEKASTFGYYIPKWSLVFPEYFQFLWCETSNTISRQCVINIWSYARPFRGLTKTWPKVHKYNLLLSDVINFNASNKKTGKAESTSMFLLLSWNEKHGCYACTSHPSLRYSSPHRLRIWCNTHKVVEFMLSEKQPSQMKHHSLKVLIYLISLHMLTTQTSA